MPLIQCDDGHMAPAIIVCRHLLSGQAKVWVEVPTPEGETFDYLCPACFEKGPKRIAAEDLSSVCMHCAREMRENRPDAQLVPYAD